VCGLSPLSKGGSKVKFSWSGDTHDLANTVMREEARNGDLAHADACAAVGVYRALARKHGWAGDDVYSLSMTVEDDVVVIEARRVGSSPVVDSEPPEPVVDRELATRERIAAAYAANAGNRLDAGSNAELAARGVYDNEGEVA
jgi:hypothetical protein